jgi:hypothetical protein
MTAGRTQIVLALLALALPAGAAAQGLGDTAAQQREKRAKEAQAKKAESKVFTNEDLAAGRPPEEKTADGKASGTGTGSAAPEASGASEAPPEPDRLALEQPYIQAIRSAQDQVTSLEARIRELGAKLNPMSTTFIYGSVAGNGANEEAQTRAALSQAEAQLAEARKAVVAANQSLQDFRRRPASSSSSLNH